MSRKRYEVIKPLKNQINHSDKSDRWFKTVEISLTHSTTSMNYFTNKVNPAGFYLHFTPVEVDNSGGFQMKQTVLFHPRSFKMKCNQIERFSAKRFEKMVEILQTNIDKIVELYDKKLDNELYAFVCKIFSEVK